MTLDCIPGLLLHIQSAWFETNSSSCSDEPKVKQLTERVTLECQWRTKCMLDINSLSLRDLCPVVDTSLFVEYTCELEQERTTHKDTSDTFHSQEIATLTVVIVLAMILITSGIAGVIRAKRWMTRSESATQTNDDEEGMKWKRPRPTIETASAYDMELVGSEGGTSMSLLHVTAASSADSVFKELRAVLHANLPAEHDHRSSRPLAGERERKARPSIM